MNVARGLVSSLVVAGVLSSSGRAARAQSDDAEALVRRGIELRRTAHDAQALELFRRAYALKPTARARAQIGLAEQALGDWLHAEADISAALQDGNDDWIARNDKPLEAALHDVTTHVASVDVRANVEGAELWLDGTLYGKLPLSSPAKTMGGSTTITVRADGFEPVEQTVMLFPGVDFRETVTLHPLPKPDQPVEAAVPVPAAAPAQPPTVLTEPTVVAPSPTPDRRATTMGWVLAGTSGALLGGGVAATVVASANASVYNDDARCLYGNLTRDQRCGAYRDRAEAATALSIVGYALGAASGVGALLLLTIAKPHGIGSAFIACGPAGAAMACEGVF